jgi:hypothetical protein
MRIYLDEDLASALLANGEILTLAETADYLRVTENEVARLVRDQGLPGRKLGGHGSPG